MFLSLIAIILLLVSTYICGAILRRCHYLGPQTPNTFATPKLYRHWEPLFGLDDCIANMLAIKEHRLLKRQRDLHEKYGPTYALVSMGTPTIRTIEPSNIKTVLSSKFMDFGVGVRRKMAFEPLLGSEISIFQLDHKEWKVSRSSLKPLGTIEEAAQLEVFEKHLQHLFIILAENDSTCLDLAPLFSSFAADVSSQLLFGISMRLLDCKTPESVQFFTALQDAQKACEIRYQAGVLAGLIPSASFKKNVSIVRNYLRTRLGTNVVSPDRQISLFDRSQLCDDELLTLFIAATDTIASTLTNLFHSLSQNSQHWRKLSREVSCLGLGIDHGTGSPQAPSIEQLKSLNYAQYCINESQRMFPVVPSNSRIAYRNTSLPSGGGPDGQKPILVPKGTMVTYSLTALQRCKDIWGDDCMEYRPDRWDVIASSGMGKQFSDAWIFLPFSNGPRVCLGKHIAKLETLYVLVRMAQRFKNIETCDQTEWTERLAMACTSKNGCKVMLHPY